MFCSHCGKQCATTATFCSGCGARMGTTPTNPNATAVTHSIIVSSGKTPMIAGISGIVILLFMLLAALAAELWGLLILFQTIIALIYAIRGCRDYKNKNASARRRLKRAAIASAFSFFFIFPLLATVCFVIAYRKIQVQEVTAYVL